MTKKIKVVYIAGRGHSGSTLLDLILGSHSRLVSVGEIKQKALTRLFSNVSKRPCTCGARVGDCKFWNAVRTKLEAQGIISGEKIESGDPVANRIFVQAVLEVSGKHIYVESTKSPERLERLMKCPDFDVFVVGLYRDPRAVGYSGARKGRSYYIGFYKWWKLYRKIDRLMACREDSFIRTYYEDFVVDPKAEVKRIMHAIGDEFEAAQLNYHKHEHHNLEGNRMRFNEQSEIRPSTSYLDTLSPLQWLAGSMISALFLHRFGYAFSKNAMRWRIRREKCAGTKHHNAI
ncbi:sulfotransferase [Saliniramus fredricksonii]|uniref:Sulfotransferase family protein n=1 Tax=Saliniramus fredricksonii TaxID=1653334 RepID=A0ABY0K6Y5_9HYPH|nr:sulfotransferase [Saliniramus fredricksonii]SCC79482.1 Sulfotransferase family protein [Saliniramus fredricksonii]